MALLWSKQIQDRHYEVRSAGSSRRLYTNGVLHSAYNPQHAFTGSIWDLIFLPALYDSVKNCRRVLLLGAGGGAVIHLLNRYVKPKSITAIDIDKTHLDVAKRFFEVDYKNVTLIHADAIEWIKQYRGDTFDLLIEDLFIEQDSVPIRLMHEDAQWLQRLMALTHDAGTLVINHGDKREAAYTRTQLPKSKKVYQFSQTLLENRVLALRNRAFPDGLFKQNLENHNLKRQALNYRMVLLDNKKRR